MSTYGYDPSRFINDYSWIGDIGRVVSKTASKIPELVEYNKQLHTNTQFKRMNYEAMSQMIGNLEGDQLAKVALGFGVTIPKGGLPEGESHYDYLRKRLQEKVPTFHDTMDNKEYAHQVANQFAAPMAKLIFDGTMNYSDFFDWKQGLPGDMQEPIAQSSMGQQMSQEREHQRGIAQEEAQYDRDRGRETEMAADLEGIYQDVVGLYDPKLSVPENFRKMSSEIGGTAKHRGIDYGPEQSTIIYNRIRDLANMEQKSRDSDRAHHARMTAARNRGRDDDALTPEAQARIDRTEQLGIERLRREFERLTAMGDNRDDGANKRMSELNDLINYYEGNSQAVQQIVDRVIAEDLKGGVSRPDYRVIRQDARDVVAQKNAAEAVVNAVAYFKDTDNKISSLESDYSADDAEELFKKWKEHGIDYPFELVDGKIRLKQHFRYLEPVLRNPTEQTVNQIVRDALQRRRQRRTGSPQPQTTGDYSSSRESFSVSGSSDDVKQWSDDDAIAEVRRRIRKQNR